jgi:hypothetical protein
MVRFIIRTYGILVSLYPWGFRAEFAAEMRKVFAEAVGTADKRGWLSLTAVCLREIGDLPPALMREYWSEFRNRGLEGLMPALDGAMNASGNGPGTWLEAILAGLPHLLYALAMELPPLLWVLFDVPYNWRPPRLALWVLVGVMLIVGWRRGWPRWSGSWIGFGLVFALYRGMSFFPHGPMAHVTMIAWLTLVGVTYFWLAQRDRLSGLLAVFPLVPMFTAYIGLDVAIETLIESPVFIGVGLLAALGAAVIVRLGSWRAGVWLALAVVLVTQIPVSYAATYHSNLRPPYEISPTASNLIKGVLGGLLALVIFSAPLWLSALWQQGKRWKAGL